MCAVGFLGALACGEADTGGDPGPESIMDPGNDPQQPGMEPGSEGDGSPDCASGPVPGAASSRLLTRLQYDNTVRDLLGDSSRPAQAFPPENTLLGFSNNAEVHRSNLLLAEHHMTAAAKLAESAVSERLEQLLPCAADERNAACAQRFVAEFGRRAFRRPLTQQEASTFGNVFAQAEPAWGFERAIELVIEVFLQSPQFLYRTESLAAPTEGKQVLALDSFQVASRLSYFLWNSMPDEELLTLAEAGELSTREHVAEQARRMLEDPKAFATVSDFHAQWLGLNRFDGLVREADEGVAPGSLNEAWRQSLLDFTDHAFWDGEGTLSQLLTSSRVFLNDPLRSLYGLGPDQEEDPLRAGILTQPGLMALLAHPDQSAPIQRGLFVRERMLCQQLAPPPPDVDASPPDPDPSATTRERFRQHTADDRCATCHSMIDGIGFGLEGFDQVGRFRDSENGFDVDTSGSIQRALDPELNGTFDGALELSERLSQSAQVEECMATQWFRYTMGRADQTADSCSLGQIQAQFAESGGSFQELLVAIATSDVFRFRAAGEQDLP